MLASNADLDYDGIIKELTMIVEAYMKAVDRIRPYLEPTFAASSRSVDDESQNSLSYEEIMNLDRQILIRVSRFVAVSVISSKADVLQPLSCQVIPPLFGTDSQDSQKSSLSQITSAMASVPRRVLCSNNFICLREWICKR